MTYIDPDLIDDEGAVAEGILAALADLIPSWQASEHHIETALAEAFGMVIATAVARIKLEERNTYAGFGERVLELERIAAGVASSTATITLADNLGHTITGGYQIAATKPTGETVALATAADVVVPAGQTSAFNVQVIALEAGPDSNGAITVVDREDLAEVTQVTLNAPTEGGSDAEALDAYITRVARRARRLRALPVTPDDYAELALDVPDVGRALAVNLLDPATPADALPGHVTIYAAAVSGADLAPATSDALLAYLTAVEKVLNCVVHLADPDRVALALAVTVRRAAGYTEAQTQAAVEAALAAYTDPASWAYDAEAPGRWRPTKPILRVFDIAAAIDDLPELADVVSVTINGATDPVTIPRTALLAATPPVVTVTV